MHAKTQLSPSYSPTPPVITGKASIHRHASISFTNHIQPVCCIHSLPPLSVKHQTSHLTLYIFTPNTLSVASVIANLPTKHTQTNSSLHPSCSPYPLHLSPPVITSQHQKTHLTSHIFTPYTLSDTFVTANLPANHTQTLHVHSIHCTYPLLSLQVTHQNLI